MNQKDRFLITGSAGFIGSVLLRRLVGLNQETHIILRPSSNTWRIDDLLPRVTTYKSDLSDPAQLTEIVQRVKPNVIYHLATHGAYSSQKDPNQIIQTNILGTWNLLQACNTIPYKLFVNTGSSSEYGFKEFAMRETDHLQPASYYAVTKCAQTHLCTHLAKQEGRPIVTIRPFSVYGPYEEPGRFIPTLMKAILFKEEMNLVSPDIARDYIYINDMVDAYLKIKQLIKNPGECFNIGTGVQSTIKETVEIATKVTHETTDFKWGTMTPKKWDTNNWVADISQARRLLKWSPRTNLTSGLELTWKWFKDNSQFYQPKT